MQVKISIISQTGFGLGLATRLIKEGHAVQLYSEFKSGFGIIDRNTDDPITDLAIFDHASYGAEAEELKKIGTKVLGASAWSSLIDTDENYAKSVIEMLGWKVATNTDGINLYITTWFNGVNFINTYSSLVYRRFMSGGRGPDVKDTGVISDCYQPTERVWELLRPLQPVLRKVNHRGCFHIHVLIKESQYTVVGISTSFDTPLTLPLFENTNLSKTEILLRLLDETSKPIQPIDRSCAVILVTVPPYPYNIESESSNIKGINESNLKHLWMMNIMQQDGQYMTTPDSGKVLYVAARGGYLQEAARRAYRTIGNLVIKDIQYRNDIGRDVHLLINDLVKHRWLKESIQPTRSEYGNKEMVSVKSSMGEHLGNSR